MINVEEWRKKMSHCWTCKAGFLAPCRDCGYFFDRLAFYNLTHEEQGEILGVRKCMNI